MKVDETSATVGDQRKVHIDGVQFQPGARVDVTITPGASDSRADAAQSKDRTTRLLAALDAARKRQDHLGTQTILTLSGCYQSPK